MPIESLVAQLRDATASTSRRGVTLYVSAPLYAVLSAEQRLWLWERALNARLVLITDMKVDPSIVVRGACDPEPGGAARSAAA